MVVMKHFNSILLLIVFSSANSYDTDTHLEMSQNAIENSILSTNDTFYESIGLNISAETNFFPSFVPADPNGSNPNETIFLEQTSIIRILSGGAVLEDASTRSVHHFFDPQNESVGGSVGLPSPTWSLESVETSGINENFNFNLLNQTYSYGDALDYFYLALTSANEEDRLVNFGLMFRSLGHVIHHLQDMAQPQHVRDDLHCDATSNFSSLAFLCFFAGKHNPSYYENYTNSRIDNIPVTIASSTIPQFTSAREFWVNAGGSGIAEYTSKNFVSAGTNFQGNADDGFIPHPSYPSPAPLQEVITLSLIDMFNEDTTINEIEKTSILNRLRCDLNPCLLDFIQNKIVDINGSETINTRTSTLSFFDEELQSRNLNHTLLDKPGVRTERVVSLNRFNFESIYPFLLPRAIAYSAGLINHFFRGRIKVEEVGWADEENISVKLKNISANGNSLLQGNYEVYYGSLNGTRKPVQSVTIQGGHVPLAASQTIELKFNKPEDLDESLDEPYVTVFNGLDGLIGNEPGLATTQFKQPGTGTVQDFFFVASECPSKQFVVMVDFDEQPANNGKVVLQGITSGESLDFRNIPTGKQGVISGRFVVVHSLNTITGIYRYQVAVTPDGFDTENTCNTPSIGNWVPGENVVPISIDNTE